MISSARQAGRAATRRCSHRRPSPRRSGSDGGPQAARCGRSGSRTGHWHRRRGAPCRSCHGCRKAPGTQSASPRSTRGRNIRATWSGLLARAAASLSLPRARTRGRRRRAAGRWCRSAEEAAPRLLVDEQPAHQGACEHEAEGGHGEEAPVARHEEVRVERPQERRQGNPGGLAGDPPGRGVDIDQPRLALRAGRMEAGCQVGLLAGDREVDGAAWVGPSGGVALRAPGDGLTWGAGADLRSVEPFQVVSDHGEGAGGTDEKREQAELESQQAVDQVRERPTPRMARPRSGLADPGQVTRSSNRR